MFQPNIRINDLNVSFGDRKILKDVCIEVPPNKITAVIGPSGCGKSTLLKCINRLIDLNEGVKVSGKVAVNGEDVFEKSVDVNGLRKRMGLIAQTPNPLPMSLFDNVAFGPKIHGLRDKKKLDEIVEQCLKSAGLWEEVKTRLNEPASKLSIGQQQRLCLARALAVKPDCLLCDEPTSALDPISAEHIEKQLLALKSDYTIVFVTHVLRQAKRLADYVIFLYLGEVVECGPAEKVFNHPDNPRTKAYIEGIFG